MKAERVGALRKEKGRVFQMRGAETPNNIMSSRLPARGNYPKAIAPMT